MWFFVSVHWGFFLFSRARGRWKRWHWSQVSCCVWSTPSSRSTSSSNTPRCCTPSCPSMGSSFFKSHVSPVTQMTSSPWSLSIGHILASAGTAELWSPAAVLVSGWAPRWRRSATTNTENTHARMHAHTHTHTHTVLTLRSPEALKKGLKQPLNVSPFLTCIFYEGKHCRMS